MYRKSRSPAKFRLLDAVPTWGQAQTDTTNLLFKMLMEKLGVTDVPSYFRRLWFWIAACVVLVALFGAHRSGFEGVIWGALAGIAAPGVIFISCFATSRLSLRSGRDALPAARSVQRSAWHCSSSAGPGSSAST